MRNKERQSSEEKKIEILSGRRKEWTDIQTEKNKRTRRKRKKKGNGITKLFNW